MLSDFRSSFREKNVCWEAENTGRRGIKKSTDCFSLFVGPGEGEGVWLLPWEESVTVEQVDSGGLTIPARSPESRGHLLYCFVFCRDKMLWQR